MQLSRYAAIAVVVAAAAAPPIARDPLRAVALALIGLAGGLAIPAVRLGTSIAIAAVATVALLAADGLRAGDPAPLFGAAAGAASVGLLCALHALEAALGSRR